MQLPCRLTGLKVAPPADDVIKGGIALQLKKTGQVIGDLISSQYERWHPEKPHPRPDYSLEAAIKENQQP